MRRRITKKCPKCGSDMELHVDYYPPQVLDWEIGGGTAPLPAYEPIPSACAAGTDDDSYSEVYWKCSKCDYSE